MANKWFFKEIRRIHASDLRALCVKNDWYTRGDNEEYGHLLFDLAGHKDNITTDDVCEIVQDIIDHSDATCRLWADKVPLDNHIWGCLCSKTASEERVKSTYAKEAEELKNWLLKRMDWLHENLEKL